MKRTIAALATTFAIAGAAQAEVTDRSATGFQSVQKLTIAAPPQRVYDAILQVGNWWSSPHSYSGDAANLSIDLAKGCFCEKLPKGEVRHMEVLSYDGETSLILSGAMGPLVTTAAFGHMAFALKEVAGKTELTLTYNVGGYAKGGFEAWADPVDGVLAEQTGRLKTYVETGRAD